ncbi:hypothetical protein BD779DRAFT_1676153 [Infundibulicybe gibba]|nr:hypothetical protein BD779DRAFT_1676153 [Infundibulicybe gibba]
MGPGSRRDTLDDHFGDYNWRKVIGLGIGILFAYQLLHLPTATGPAMLRKVKEAGAERSELVSDFLELSASISKEYPEQVVKWTADIQAWEQDRTKPNPFTSPVDKVSENAVRLELAREEEHALALGQLTFFHDEISPSMLITQGIEIEDQQRNLKEAVKGLGNHPTDLQQAKIQESRNRLRRRIDAWREIQQLYLPGVINLRAQSNSQATSNKPPEAWDLFLPSEILDDIPLEPCFLDFEWRLRQAQAFVALDSLRRHLTVRSQMFNSKFRHVRGQKSLTRSQKLIERIQARVTHDAKKYREVHAKLGRLATPLKKQGWTKELQILAEGDVRGLNAGDEGTTEGRRTVSWIWKAPTGQNSGTTGGEEVVEALRIEWLKARARAHRWQEECLLLTEEMRRALAFFRSEIDSWTQIGHRLTPTDSNEGLRAYAFRQANSRDGLLTRCKKTWSDCAQYLELGEGAPTEGMIKVEYYPDSCMRGVDS